MNTQPERYLKVRGKVLAAEPPASSRALAAVSAANNFPRTCASERKFLSTRSRTSRNGTPNSEIKFTKGTAIRVEKKLVNQLRVVAITRACHVMSRAPSFLCQLYLHMNMIVTQTLQG